MNAILCLSGAVGQTVRHLTSTAGFHFKHRTHHERYREKPTVMKSRRFAACQLCNHRKAGPLSRNVHVHCLTDILAPTRPTG